MSFNIKERLDWRPPELDTFRSCLHRINPPLDLSKLNLYLLEGEERQILRTPTVGSFTLALWYKGCEGAVASLREIDLDLIVLQLQGAKTKKSYRVASGMDWVRLFANEVRSVAEHPLSPFQRLVMPALCEIKGLAEELARRDGVDSKYTRFATLTGLRFSQLEKAYIRDINRE